MNSSSKNWKKLGRPNSKDIAKERLKLVLLHDRMDLSPKILEQLKNEIIHVLSKYIEIDEDATDIEITRVSEDLDDEAMSALIANIPILSIRDSSLR